MPCILIVIYKTIIFTFSSRADSVTDFSVPGDCFIVEIIPAVSEFAHSWYSKGFNPPLHHFVPKLTFDVTDIEQLISPHSPISDINYNAAYKDCHGRKTVTEAND